MAPGNASPSAAPAGPPTTAADVAGALLGGMDALTARVQAAIVLAVPALDADPEVRLALERSIEANLAGLLALLAEPELPVDGTVPPEALNLATTLVRRGVDPSDFVHASLVGQNELWRAWMEELARQIPSGPALVAALERTSDRLFARADFLVAQLMRHVDRERERWMGGAIARRTQLVVALLAGQDTTAGDASRALGYDIDRWVLAAVVWDAAGEADPESRHEALERQAARLARAAGTARAFTVAAGDATIWAWVAARDAPDIGLVQAELEGSLDEGQAVALGTVGAGLEGFRASHDEALEARRVAALGDRTGVIRYDRVEALSLICDDLDRLRRFVVRTLGPLSADDEPTARLRETLAAWLAEGGNARRAAERLNAHKNTVLYRLHRAERLLGRPLDERRGDLELALSAVDWLGSRVAGPAAPLRPPTPNAGSGFVRMPVRIPERRA